MKADLFGCSEELDDDWMKKFKNVLVLDAADSEGEVLSCFA